MTAAGKPPRPRFPAALSAVAPGAAAKGLLRPQRPLADAARDAHRTAAPQPGLGLDSAAVRQRMVDRLRHAGIQAEGVLTALRQVPRHLFVDSALAVQAYEDTALPIGQGQTISKPSVVARMLEWLLLGQRARQLGHLGRVLEIGTGCGYQAAVLAQLAEFVVTVERLAALHDLAARLLSRPDMPAAAPCLLVFGDGMLGVAEHAPFDSIIAAAGGDELPQAWLEQLAIGGRLVAPARDPASGEQTLVIVDRTERGWHCAKGEVVQFVPLKSGTA